MTNAEWRGATQEGTEVRRIRRGTERLGVIENTESSVGIRASKSEN